MSRDLAKYDATEDGEERNTENVRMLYRPRGAQIEALYALQESRMEGAAKGLVYAATGIGKTYLAAFDSAKYERVIAPFHDPQSGIIRLIIHAVIVKWYKHSFVDRFF